MANFVRTTRKWQTLLWKIWILKTTKITIEIKLISKELSPAESNCCHPSKKNASTGLSKTKSGEKNILMIQRSNFSEVSGNALASV